MSLLNLDTGQATMDELAGAYLPGSSFFASPRGALLAGQFIACPGAERTDQAALAANVALDQAAAAGSTDAVVLGALPFDVTARPCLSLAAATRRAGPVDLPPDEQHHRGAPPVLVESLPDRAGYAESVTRALDRIARGELEKVVLARTLRLTYAESVSVAELVRGLARRNPRGYTFAVELPDTTVDQKVLVGASPELLISKFGNQIASWPLAGSAPRGAEPAEDRARAAALLASEKDLREHQPVVRAVADVLRPYCTTLHVPERPALTATPAVWHLGTRITGTLRDIGVSSLELATALHPTPAICGWPASAALSVIGELEPFDRGCYAGAVGWCDANGDGEWALAIRSAEVTGHSVRLFAGAGIVAGSDPRGEVMETTAKFRTMLAALGVDPASLERDTL